MNVRSDDPRFEFLLSLPIHVAVNFIVDQASDDIGMSMSTFALSMDQRLKNTMPEDAVRLCAERIVSHILSRRVERNLREFRKKAAALRDSQSAA